MSEKLSIIILAAGKGTRMKSDLPKVMHKIAGREMLNLVIDQAKHLKPSSLQIVISDDLKIHRESLISKHPQLKLDFVIQNERKGTAHAVSSAIVAFEESIAASDKVLILYGDTPLITSQTMQKMLDQLDFDQSANHSLKTGSRLCVLGFDDESPNNYGRLVVGVDGKLQRIVEFKDASHEEKQISLCNSGVIACGGKNLISWIKHIKNDNAAGEFYLTDIIAIANADKNCTFEQSTFIKTNNEEVLGVNSRLELSKAEEIIQKRLRQKAMIEGATLICPETIFLSFDSKIGRDVIIHPNVVIGCGVEIADLVEIKSFCHLESAQIASGAVIGPFARIRPGTKIGNGCRIGNFVEIKNSDLANGAKVNHLTYLGDCEVGQDSNIGAGTITCNFDGFKKYRTKIGKKVFVGSNTALVAPIEIADEAMIGAGSVITKNVEQNELAVARSKQINLENGAKKFRQKSSNNLKS